jgi:hypothetical protein
MREGLHEDVVDCVKADRQVYVYVLLRVPHCEITHNAGVPLRILDGAGDGDVLFVTFEVFAEGGVEFNEFDFPNIGEFVLLVKNRGKKVI